MKNTKYITLLYFNARSIRNKLLDLEITLSSQIYDIVFISETWLKETDLNSFIIDTHKYCIIRNDRETHAGGVAAIYNSIYSDKIITIDIDSNDMVGFELIAFNFYSSPNTYICFVCLYLPPQASTNPSTVSNLIKVLKRFASEREVC